MPFPNNFLSLPKLEREFAPFMGCKPLLRRIASPRFWALPGQERPVSEGTHRGSDLPRNRTRNSLACGIFLGSPL